MSCSYKGVAGWEVGKDEGVGDRFGYPTESRCTSSRYLPENGRMCPRPQWRRCLCIVLHAIILITVAQQSSNLCISFYKSNLTIYCCFACVKESGQVYIAILSGNKMGFISCVLSQAFSHVQSKFSLTRVHREQ